jgi:uncharacterized membrane protein YkvA (DUF1232 family)
VSWWQVIVGVAFALLAVYAVLLVVLLRARPRAVSLTEAARLLPDVLRLLRRLAADPAVPASVRVRLWLLLGYLALPVDLVPDVVPVLGYADDVLVALLVLRSAVRATGTGTLERHWPGTPEGLDVVLCAAALSPTRRDRRTSRRATPPDPQRR